MPRPGARRDDRRTRWGSLGTLSPGDPRIRSLPCRPVPADAQVPFVLGGRLRWRVDRAAVPSVLSWLTIAIAVALPLRGLYKATGSSMEEGFMLVFPRLVQQGKVPNVDFLHLYGPASLDVLAVWYRIFGYSLESERTFGLLQHLGIILAIYTIARVAGHLAATGAALVATVLILTPTARSASGSAQWRPAPRRWRRGDRRHGRACRRQR